MSDVRDAQPARRRTINPALKLFLELGPLALFFAAYLKVDIFAGTIALMICVIAALSISYVLLRRIPIMPLVTAAIVLVFGGLTLYFHNKLFVELKLTVLYLLFAGALFIGLKLGKPLLPVLFDGAFHLTAEGWRLLTLRWGYFFLSLAALNAIVVAASQTWTPDSDAIWANFNFYGKFPIIFLFTLAQTPFIMRHESKGEDVGDAL
jgi:intracellular septation protein